MGKPKKDHYGYVLHEDGEYFKRDKSVEGLLHLGIIKLPEALKDSLKLYYKSEWVNFRLVLWKFHWPLSLPSENIGKPQDWSVFRAGV